MTRSARIAIMLAAALLAASGAMADERRCSRGSVTIDAGFDAGAIGRCRFESGSRVTLTILPEDRKVSVEQPWYAFRVSAAVPVELSIRLRFPDGYARYWPKISVDGRHWQKAADEDVDIADDRKSLTLKVAVAGTPVWIAAQELLTAAWYDDWLAELDAHAVLTSTTIGKSHEGRPIRMARSPARPEAVILLGRQHPAEVPGAIAMREFVSTVLADTPLARRFRARYMLLIVPLMNPDGVAHGHWRHNAGKTDLNRDWGPFTQPETQSIERLLAGIDMLGIEPRLMLDFHATKFTDSMLLYTQTDEDATSPAAFAVRWLDRVRQRAPDYAFVHAPRPTSAQNNTKGYFFTRYGIPAYTYEIGDAAAREPLLEVTPVFAEEMMRTLLSCDSIGGSGGP